MKRMVLNGGKVLLLLCFLLQLTGVGFAQLVTDTLVLDFKTIDLAIDEKIAEYGPENVLVVLDIDNTILTGDTDLGSDTWYQWQNDELDVKPAKDQKLTRDCLFNEAIGLLYELGTMALTDSLLPGYMEKWQSSGLTLFALTSRNPDYRAATERELARNGIDLSKAQLKTYDNNELFLDYKLERDLSYYNGIMMTTGMNKGVMLSHILGRSGRTFKAIIFVDDTRKNIDAVKTSYSGVNTNDVILFHYHKIVSERLRKNNNRVLTEEQAEKMAEDWELLIRTIMTVFPERLAKSDCATISGQ